MKRFLYIIALLLLLFSCENRPSLVEQRKAEIKQNDSLELVRARADLAQADSVTTFKELELADLQKQFIFEKQEKFQTIGCYVLPSYAGSKAKFSFFPEVEEGGALLLVSIDKKRNYTFKEIPLADPNYEAYLPSGLSTSVKNDIAQCYTLAKAIQDLQAARELQEKLTLKVLFYEKKGESR